MVSPFPLALAETLDGYVVKSSSPNSNDPGLLISGSGCSLVDNENINPTSPFTTISGVIGIIRLRSNSYVITADGAMEVGNFLGHKFYKVSTHSILPLGNHLQRYAVVDDETKYLELLKNHLNEATLYFSYTYDLTNSLQRQAMHGEYSWRNADPSFFWNHFVLSDLMALAKDKPAADMFVLPLIYGYVNIVKTSVSMKSIGFGLITRRSRFRAGTRYFRRGIDESGNAANFNETEQVLSVSHADGQDVFSYLQTRGSVPVYWAEINNLKYKPHLFIGPSSLSATKDHFSHQVEKYGTNYLVNLVNQKGYEKPVKSAYENAVNSLGDPRVKYVYFDFHHECRKMKWYRVRLLLDHLREMGLSPTDYFHETVGEKVGVSKTQTSVVRTNCMDCLDRTNVVQSTLGRWVLQSQLESVGVLVPGQSWEKDVSFNLLFQNLWADNADYVSKSYSGTGALKTDFTRTGNRTKKGAFNDFINSVTRYLKNNYKDGPRQDGYDLFLGNFLPFESVSSPFADQRPALIQAMPFGLFASVAVLVTTIIYPRGSLFELKNFSFLCVCLALVTQSLNYILKNGYQFVNWPKLCKLDFLEKKEVLKDGKFRGIQFVRNGIFASDSDVAKKE
ncbi:unnamed protein product [Kuraishia capsulata CBS 1993]|uniref:SAC domain-containing protein n=1 Tax=Kuraishia capsulata CBS 1993 TaxID=1382522 RepID=W6ML13_9ASCO|nr:uncharacterized protein KUCA_T00003098001 [Kuraishia capsulata CBS 1993]CDK27121.1 unnamed protein product [Kuraishia capsulata CBS 1993]